MADLHSLRRILKMWGYSLGALKSANAYRILDKSKAPQKFGPDGRTVLTLEEVDKFVESVQAIRCANDVPIETWGTRKPSHTRRSIQATRGYDWSDADEENAF